MVCVTSTVGIIDDAFASHLLNKIVISLNIFKNCSNFSKIIHSLFSSDFSLELSVSQQSGIKACFCSKILSNIKN